MIFEIRFLGILVVIDPKTVEALIQFASGLLGRRPEAADSASSKSKTLDS